MLSPSRAQLSQSYATLGVALFVSLAVHAVFVVRSWITVDAFTPSSAPSYSARLVPLEQDSSSSEYTPQRATPKRIAPRTSASAVDRTSAADTNLRGGSPTTPPLPTIASAAALTSASAESLVRELNESKLVAPVLPQLSLPAPITTPTDTKVETPTAAAAAAGASNPERPHWPEQFRIDYRVSSSVVDGVSHVEWSASGDQYALRSQLKASGFFASALLGVIVQTSKGTLTERGLAPTQFSLKRGDAEADVADFDRERKELRFSRRADGRPVPLGVDTQDVLSFQFQLAHVARALRPGDSVDVLLTNGRKVYRQRFTHMGPDALQLSWGTVAAVRLLSDGNTPEDRYELWLDPTQFYLPVRFKAFVGKVQVEQTATRIGKTAPATLKSTAP